MCAIDAFLKFSSAVCLFFFFICIKCENQTFGTEEWIGEDVLALASGYSAKERWPKLTQLTEVKGVVITWSETLERLRT